ncbi:hypothetical protein BCR44DRAFT_1133911 [Catenaria anguillulae PL171]|uniref:Uncharacterized protein n=1 Tax=Catenaria anguillulae PL171 TaxID=765915 RepID=A0A1Y2HKT1_9FUNG|nr:hypothetical protein BCR44DRAFT_1133911 [Catenaria anguillulae PL171]
MRPISATRLLTHARFCAGSRYARKTACPGQSHNPNPGFPRPHNRSVMHGQPKARRPHTCHGLEAMRCCHGAVPLLRPQRYHRECQARVLQKVGHGHSSVAQVGRKLVGHFVHSCARQDCTLATRRSRRPNISNNQGRRIRLVTVHSYGSGLTRAQCAKDHNQGYRVSTLGPKSCWAYPGGSRPMSGCFGP